MPGRPALIGPVRSARNIDIGILGQLGNPLLAHVGGINPVLANINASPVVNVDIGTSQSLMIHPPDHVAPDSDYTSTAIVYGTHPTMTTPPQPLFTYSADYAARGHGDLQREHQLLGHVERDLEVEQGDRHLPALLQRHDAGHAGRTTCRTQAATVVVQYVQISYGPWLENDQGGKEVQADLYPNASGTAVIYRNGYAIPGTWHRSTLGSPTQFVNAFGVPIPMQPGQTWVELVPNTIMATTTP